MNGAHEISNSRPRLRRKKFPFRAIGDRRDELRELTPAMRNALRRLFSDICFIRHATGWVGQSGAAFQEVTITALFDRNLIKVFVENRPTPRCRYVATLTDIGQLVASAIAGVPAECGMDEAKLVYGEAAE